MSKENIHDLESKTLAIFTELRYSRYSIKHMLVMARTIIRLHVEQDEEFFKRDIIENYINHQEMRYQNNEIGKSTFYIHRIAAAYMTQINDTGMIVKKKSSRLPVLPDGFNHVLTDILSNEEWSRKHRKHQYDHAQTFFRWLRSYGYNDLRHVDEHVVREYLIDCSARMVGYSLNNRRRALKQLFLFLSKDGVLSEQMSKLFLFEVAIEKKIKPFMPQDEIAAVLNFID